MSLYASIIHREKIAVQYLRALKSAYWMKHAFTTPKNLTIITVSTYEEKSLFEQSLDYLGIKDYVVLNEPFDGPFKHTLKLCWILNYLKSGACKTEYLLFCDARDSILRVDPQKVIDLFEEREIDLLFNSSMSKLGYACMPDIFEWTKTVAYRAGRYLNSGAFIGKTEFIKEVFEEANEYVDLDNPIYVQRPKNCSEFPEFPKGTSDQIIFRYLEPQFYPKLSIDYINRIFYRN